MVAVRLLALAAVAFSFVGAQDSATIGDKSTKWKFSAGSKRITDHNEAVRGGSYTVIPINGTAKVTFHGSGGSVYFVSPKGARGKAKFYLDGKYVGSVENVRPSPQVGYNERTLSRHGLRVGSHTFKIVALSMPIGIDALVYNPDKATADDPED